MGCERSSYYEEREAEQYKEKLNKVESLSHVVLLSRLEEIESLVNRINDETKTGSRYLFRLLDDIKNTAHWVNW